MKLCILLMISVVQVTPLTTPKANSLSSMQKFMLQLRVKLVDPEKFEPEDYRDFSKIIKRLACRVHEASKKLESLDALSNQDGNVFQNLARTLDLDTNAPMQVIEKNIQRIKDLHQEFLENWTKSDVVELRKSIFRIVEPRSNNVPALLKDTHRLIAPAAYDDNGYTRLGEKAATLSKDLCGLSITLSIYRLHAAIVHAELLGYVMGIYAYTLKSVVRQKSYEVQKDHLQISTEFRLTEYLNAIKNLPSNISARFANCEHKEQHIRGATYVDFEGLHQGYLVNQKDAFSEQSCKFDCKDIEQGSAVFRHTDTDHPWVYNKACPESLYDCRYFGDSVEACEAADDSGRRYDYLKGDSDTYGTKSCSETEQTSSWHYWFHRCDYCFCICFDTSISSKSTRAISFQWSMARFKANMVVTGIRFKLQYGLIHLQVHEGRLTPGGGIEKGTERWVPLQKFDLRVEANYDQFYIGSKFLKHGIDYSFIDDYNSGVEIADYSVPAGKVVVGARLSMIKSRIVVQLAHIDFDFTMGELPTSKRSTFYSAMTVTKNEFKLNNPDRPILHYNNKLFYDRKWIRLQATNLKNDVAQSTVPYFDARGPVVHFPISGVGIAYRGVENGQTGGFFVPTLKPFDLRKNIDSEGA